MPFADYVDFDDCVAQNQDMDNPEAFCAWLHYETTGTWPGEKELEKYKNKKGGNMVERKQEDSFEGYITKLQGQLQRYYPGDFITCTFRDAVIVSNYDSNLPKYYEVPYEIKGEEIEFGPKTEVSPGYVSKKIKEAGEENVFITGAELTGPIFKQDEKQRIVYAAVLVPGEPDYDYSKGEKILTPEEIEYVAHKWMEDYGNIDYMHGMNNVAKPVETFILPQELEVELEGKKTILPKGSWILAAKVTNDKAWKEVEEGKLTGFSIMGIQNTVLKDILSKAADDQSVGKAFSEAMKRILIRDLGKDWVVPFVSLVDEPCVPKAKFFAIKQREEPKKSEETTWSKFKQFFAKSAEKSGRAISDETYSDLKKAVEALQKLIEKADKERRPEYMKNKSKGDEDMNEEEVMKKIDERLDERLKPIEEGLKTLLSTDKKDEKDASSVEDEEKNALKVENLSLKETLDKLQEEKVRLEKELNKGVSKSAKGQEDDEGISDSYTYKDHLKELGRDSQGRAITRKEMK